MLMPNTLSQKHGDEAEPAERGEEGEGQRHAGEIRGDAGEGQRRGAYPVGQAAAHDGDGDGQTGEARRACAEARLTLIEIQ